MSWSDEPTEMQLGIIYDWLSWVLNKDLAKEATLWLKNSATRRDVSFEMKRLRDLKVKRLLTASNCFKSEIWEGFNHD